MSVKLPKATRDIVRFLANRAAHATKMLNEKKATPFPRPDSIDGEIRFLAGVQTGFILAARFTADNAKTDLKYGRSVRIRSGSKPAVKGVIS